LSLTDKASLNDELTYLETLNAFIRVDEQYCDFVLNYSGHTHEAPKGKLKLRENFDTETRTRTKPENQKTLHILKIMVGCRCFMNMAQVNIVRCNINVLDAKVPAL